MGEPRFVLGDLVSDGRREGIVAGGRVNWVGGGTSDLDEVGLRPSTEARFELAMVVHQERAPDPVVVGTARRLLDALQSGDEPQEADA